MILCAGEALIDMLPDSKDGGAVSFRPFPGGAVFNTAIALGRLGVTTGFVSGLGTDLFGQMLERALEQAGVSTALCVRSSRPATLAFVSLVNGQASYTFYDENSAGRMVTAQDMPALPTSCEAAFFGGISLVVEPSGTAYEALMMDASRQMVTMIDPNIRRGFITDEPAYRARIGRMIAAADIVKMSDEDLTWLEGDGELGDLARGLLARGPRLVLLTKGGKGAVAYGQAGEVSVAAQPVQVVDTVGAGDTFNAGALAALSDAGLLTKDAIAGLTQDDMRAVLSLATRAAAVTVSRAGANPPYRGELG